MAICRRVCKDNSGLLLTYSKLNNLKSPTATIQNSKLKIQNSDTLFSHNPPPGPQYAQFRNT